MSSTCQRQALTVITILFYEKAQFSSVYGLQDLFRVALMAYSQAKVSPSHHLLVQVCREAELPSLDPSLRHIIIIPPSLEGIPQKEDHVVLLEQLRYWHRQGVTLTSVCAGAFLLAEAGLLDEGNATTHWAYADILKECFPHVRVNADQLLVDNGQIITAGGLMAWVDLGLHIVGRIFGNAIMTKTAHFMLVKPPRQQQSPYIDVQLCYNHSDKDILKAQRWLENEYLPSITVAKFSNASGLTRRTFLRRFKQATGLTPKDYLLHQIIAHARQDFETTSKSVAQVAWEAGYSEIGAFRRIFKRITGLSPARYRRGQ